jgi:hypothetical protein
MKTFEVRTPDGRSIRHLDHTIDALKARLSPGYIVMGEAFGADHNGQGGYIVPLGGKSLLAVLLESHGDELRRWLDLNGYEPALRP